MSRLLRTSLVALVIPLASISAHAQPLITAFAGNETLEGCHNHNNVVATSTCLEFIIGLGIDGSGNLLIAAGHGAAVYRVDQSGVVTLLANGPECCSAFDVAADLSGKVLVTAAHHIYRLDPSGVIASVLSGYDLAGLASDGEGNLFASDKNTDTVLRIDAQGAVAVYPGNGRHGSSGDGGLATAAKFNAPRRLAVDADGKLYIGDFFNQRVRKVDPMGSLWFKEKVGCQITGQVKLS